MESATEIVNTVFSIVSIKYSPFVFITSRLNMTFIIFKFLNILVIPFYHLQVKIIIPFESITSIEKNFTICIMFQFIKLCTNILKKSKIISG